MVDAQKVVPVIMAGGSGSRLWPISREYYPKQFHALTGESSLLQQTISRISNIPHHAPLFLCNENHRFLAAEQIREFAVDHSGIMLEPEGKNTAPAIALAAIHALSIEDDPTLLVLAADHVVGDAGAFEAAVAVAVQYAQEDKLVTFGVVPSKPETGYGYIQRGQAMGNGGGYRVAAFQEKPDLSVAESYLASGDFYWNSGMFVFKAKQYLSELAEYRPDILAACQKSLSNPSEDMDFIRVDKDSFSACPEDSIDYAVMERTENSIVVPLDADWNDVGAWSSLWDVQEKDASNNVAHGDVISVDTSGSYIFSEDKLVATVGVDNLVVVETKDAVLVADKSKSQEVKSIVNQLKHQGRNERTLHREVYRPWGKYDSIDFGGRYQVKRITVKPGEKLSIQMHHHRSEHWIVVSGTAKVTNGDEDIILTEDQSTYIPLGTVHALENPGKIPLEMIEVQTGSYLGEDDIVRFEDRYGRIGR